MELSKIFVDLDKLYMLLTRDPSTDSLEVNQKKRATSKSTSNQIILDPSKSTRDEHGPSISLDLKEFYLRLNRIGIQIPEEKCKSLFDQLDSSKDGYRSYFRLLSFQIND